MAVPGNNRVRRSVVLQGLSRQVSQNSEELELENIRKLGDSPIRPIPTAAPEVASGCCALGTTPTVGRAHCIVGLGAGAALHVSFQLCKPSGEWYAGDQTRTHLCRRRAPSLPPVPPQQKHSPSTKGASGDVTCVNGCIQSDSKRSSFEGLRLENSDGQWRAFLSRSLSLSLAQTRPKLLMLQRRRQRMLLFSVRNPMDAIDTAYTHTVLT